MNKTAQANGGPAVLRALAEKIRAIERGPHASTLLDAAPEEVRHERRLSTGWPEIDAAMRGGIAAGGLHEWFGIYHALDAATTGAPREPIRQTAAPRRAKAGAMASAVRWTPPLCILVHLAWRAIAHNTARPWIVWVGRKCHPYPRVLMGRRGGADGLIEKSLFVAPRDGPARLWAVDLALRSPAVGTVIADGCGFDMAATRRIQLLARDQSKWALVARPPGEIDKLSAAETRWRVTAAPGGGNETGVVPRWNVELLRCKGMRPNTDSRSWLLEWNRVEGAVHLSAAVADLAGAPPSERIVELGADGEPGEPDCLQRQTG